LAIRDFFRKTQDSELANQKCLRDPQQILGWLEDLCRLGTILELESADSDLIPITAKVRMVDEDAKVFSLGLKVKPAKEFASGQRLHVVFPLGRQRFQTDLVYLGRGNYLEYRFSLPTAIYHAERREGNRAKMRPRDHFTITVLQDLFEGVGFTGTLVDLSMGGCNCLIQRAIRIQDERRLPITTELLDPGATLALVRLGNLPNIPSDARIQVKLGLSRMTELRCMASTRPI
jgi:hypothetical protein